MQLDEFIANLHNILGSRYLKLMREPAEKLHKNILFSSETIEIILNCQHNWIYLENIFSASDIKKRLANESTQFSIVDVEFKKTMKLANQKKFIKKIITPKLAESFKKHKETLAKINRALEEYLEQKRMIFPRFYFLSNDELLEIFAKSKQIPEIEKHMKKCFESIYRFKYDESIKVNPMLEGIISQDNDIVEFGKNISTRTEIETWLTTL